MQCVLTFCHEFVEVEGIISGRHGELQVSEGGWLVLRSLDGSVLFSEECCLLEFKTRTRD